MTATVIRFPVERRAEPSPAEPPTAWSVQAHAVLDLAEPLVEHQPADVVVLCRQAFDLLAAAEGDIDDDVTVHVLAGRLGTLHRQASERAGEPGAESAGWLAAAWRRAPGLTRHFVAGAEHPAGHGRPISAAVAAARHRHPTARPTRTTTTTTRTAG